MSIVKKISFYMIWPIICLIESKIGSKTFNQEKTAKSSKNRENKYYKAAYKSFGPKIAQRKGGDTKSKDQSFKNL